MKRIASILTGLTLAVLFSVASAQAQYDDQKITANIPFEFTVGSHSFPAGQYQFIRTEGAVYTIRDADGRGLFVMAGAPTQSPALFEKSTLKFATVNGRHVLVQIWSDLSLSGNEFPYANTSAELAKRPTIDGTVTGVR